MALSPFCDVQVSPITNPPGLGKIEIRKYNIGTRGRWENSRGPI